MPVSSSTEHWIKPDALTINLNHFGDPDYLQVSVLAGAVVMAFKQDVIGYNAAHNYRTWQLEAANTYLETTSAVNVYAKLTRSEVNARALIVYDPILRDIEGREITYEKNEETGEEKEILGESNENFYFIFLGQISSSISPDGRSILREWTSEYRSGSLETNEQQNDWMAILNKMFRPHYDDPLNPDTLTWIEAKAHMGIAGGLTSFINNGTFNLPSIYDGLPIDYQTLYWEEIKEEVGTDEEGNPIYKTTKVLKAKGGGSGGESPNLEAYATRDWVSATFATQAAHNSIATTVGRLQSDFTAMVAALGNKLDMQDFTSWKSTNEPKIANGLTAYSWGNHADAGYVGIANEQTITGKKNFITGGLFVNGKQIKYNSEGYWELEGDLLVTGGITSFASSSGYTPSTIMDALRVDGTNLEVVNGVLTFVGTTGGGTGGLDETAVKDIIEGYGYVKATTLNVWSGSSNINKVGTITSGTWQGTPISNSRLANSSIEIAGTDVSLGSSITSSSLKTALGLNNTLTMDAVDVYISALQNQIDGLWKRNCFDDLYSTMLMADAASVSEFYGDKMKVSSLRIGDCVLSYDSENNALTIQRKDGTAMNVLVTGGLTSYSTKV